MSVLRKTVYHIAPLHGAQLLDTYESLDLAEAACNKAGPPGAVYTITTSVATIATTPHNYVVPEAAPAEAAAEPAPQPQGRKRWRPAADGDFKAPESAPATDTAAQ